ncbi:MAG: DUF1730 domain-containing protein, partial [Oscillospiraceae bacterium]
RGVDSARCRSAITQKKGVLCEAERREIAAGGLAWGCDLCTLACPHNQTDGMRRSDLFSCDVAAVLTEDNLDRLLQNRAFAWRGRAVLERNLSILSDNPL